MDSPNFCLNGSVLRSSELSLYAAVNFFAVFSLRMSLCFIVQISQPYEVMERLKYYILSVEVVFGLNLVSRRSKFSKFIKKIDF